MSEKLYYPFTRGVNQCRSNLFTWTFLHFESYPIRSESRVVQFVFVLEYNSYIQSQFFSFISRFLHVYSPMWPAYSHDILVLTSFRTKPVSLYFDVHMYSNSGIVPLLVHRKLWRHIEILFRGEFLLAHFHGAKWR